MKSLKILKIRKNNKYVWFSYFCIKNHTCFHLAGCQEHSPMSASMDLGHHFYCLHSVESCACTTIHWADTLLTDMEAIYRTTLKLCQPELENVAETEAPGDRSGNNHSGTHPCHSCKLFVLDLAAILKANLGVFARKTNKQKCPREPEMQTWFVCSEISEPCAGRGGDGAGKAARIPDSSCV